MNTPWRGIVAEPRGSGFSISSASHYVQVIRLLKSNKVVQAAVQKAKCVNAYLMKSGINLG